MNNFSNQDSGSLSLTDVLLSRRSIKAVTAPGPTAEQVELALKAAVCAPDHAALRVWRYTLIEQPHVKEFAERVFDILDKAGKPISDEKKEKARKWLKDVPLLVALAYKIHHDNPKVPVIEQTLSMGASVMNFQNAMHAMGFATFWSTGLGTFTDEVPELLGYDPLDYQFVGFLSVGTPMVAASTSERPDPSSVMRRWTPSSEH